MFAIFVFKTKNWIFSDQLCNCPQKCGEKIPTEIRTRLFADYYKLGDHLKQNYYLQSYIEMRSVHKRLYQEETRVGGRLQRRVSCKYRIPIEVPPSHPSENLSAEDLKSEYTHLQSVYFLLLGVYFLSLSLPVPAGPCHSNSLTPLLQY